MNAKEYIRTFIAIELPEDVKEKAIDNLRDINVDYEWWDMDGILDVKQSEWIKYGLKDCLFTYKTIYFDIDRESHLEFVDLKVTDDEVFRKALHISKNAWDKTTYYFRNNGSRYCNTRLEFEDPEAYSGKTFTVKEQQMIDMAIETFNDWREEALINLRKDYEYSISDEAIIETIKANDYMFTEDGKID